MASATKIGPVVPAHLVDAVTEHLPDIHHLPDMSALSAGIGDVTERLRDLSGTATSKVGHGRKSQRLGPWSYISGSLAFAVVALLLFMLLRSRRDRAVDGAPAQAGSKLQS
jgi:hypothetical protein